eukprot:CAMPEP_0119560044 /NCGR_PEP_ID=MMETSP1352-20130426/13865_1 /TAXON_ID=265584 /ORGANISM="Stauroneis constricta, Strain CCMP1120" /LENGTH=110 /DNA_ID=CAMNT_0007607911 /DNA_START=63 /DNA_END=395 /DNA_ORIENTATION=+
MKTFQIVTLFAMIAASMAFAPSQTPQIAKAAIKGAAAATPVAFLTAAAPAFATDSIVEALPSMNLSLEVQFGAYLAVLLGTFLPCLFLINLFISTETRKAGAEDALKDDF